MTTKNEYIVFSSWENRGDGYSQYWNPESDSGQEFFASYFETIKESEIESHVNKGHAVYRAIPFTLYSDYVGDTVDRANYESVYEEYKEDSRFMFLGYGYSGSQAFVKFESLGDEDIADIFNGLEDYPVIDEQKLSEIEMQLESESWDSWVKFDLTRALDQAGIEYDESTLYEDFRYVMEYNNINGTCESAVSWHVDIDKIVNVWGFHHCPNCNKRMTYKSQECDCPHLF